VSLIPGFRGSEVIPKNLIIVAENIHATRVVISPERGGKKAVLLDDGGVAVTYNALDGTKALMRLADDYKQSPEYGEGKIKHVRVAVEKGMMGQPDGIEYLQSMAKSQIDAGAGFLDVNVDEISPTVEKQVEAMTWVARRLGQFSPAPLSIDSSRPQVIEAGLEVCDPSKGRPLINSASLERPELLDSAVKYNTDVIVSAFGRTGMPSGVEDRVANIAEMMRCVDDRGIKRDRVFLDPLVLPVGTDPAAGKSFLETVRQLRSMYGPDVHITGGLSNVSFGIPGRPLLNEVFFLLALEAGCDSAIIDPTQVRVENVDKIDRDSLAFRLSHDALTGKDPFCMDYIAAFREGKLRS
jgi:5-methyltetrahydrofolate--homocysteine methyltransferase